MNTKMALAVSLSAPSQWDMVFESQPIGINLRSPNYTRRESKRVRGFADKHAAAGRS